MTAGLFRGLAAPLVLVVGFLALGACKPTPTPGSVDLVADSVGYQALLAAGGLPDEPADLERDVRMGIDASHVLAGVHNRVAASRPETLVVGLGTNDASPARGGWTWDDIALWSELLDAPHETACVVVILPGLGDGASTAHRTQVGRARVDIASMANQRPAPTVVVDWGAVVDHDPAVLEGDGIHLAKDPAGPFGIDPDAAEAWAGLAWDGAAQCPR